MPSSVLPQPAPPQTSVGPPARQSASGDLVQAADAGGALLEPDWASALSPCHCLFRPFLVLAEGVW